MNVLIIGAGMMGRAIAYDLSKYSNFENIVVSDVDSKHCNLPNNFLVKIKQIFLF